MKKSIFVRFNDKKQAVKLFPMETKPTAEFEYGFIHVTDPHADDDPSYIPAHLIPFQVLEGEMHIIGHHSILEYSHHIKDGWFYAPYLP